MSDVSYDDLDAAMDVMKACFEDLQADFHFPGKLGIMMVLVHVQEEDGVGVSPYDTSISSNLSHDFMECVLKRLLKDLRNGDLQPPKPGPSLN